MWTSNPHQVPGVPFESTPDTQKTSRVSLSHSQNQPKQKPISIDNNNNTQQQKQQKSKRATRALAKYTSQQRTLYQDENARLEVFSRFPRQIKRYLQETGAYARHKEGEDIYGGVSDIGIAWLFVRGRIFVWNCNYSKREAEFCKCLDAPAIITDIHQRYLVAAVHSGQTAFGIVFATPEGVVRYWPDFMREQFYTDHQIELEDEEYLTAIGDGMSGIIVLGSSKGRLWRCCCRPSEIEVTLMIRSSGLMSLFWSSSSKSQQVCPIRSISLSQNGEAFVLNSTSLQKWNINSSSASFNFEWDVLDLVTKQNDNNTIDKQQVYNLSIDYNGENVLLLTASHPLSVDTTDVPLLSYTVWELNPSSRDIENMYPLSYQPDYEIDFADELLWNVKIYSKETNAFYVAWSYGFVAAHEPFDNMSFIPGDLIGHGMTSNKFFGLNIKDGLLICSFIKQDRKSILDKRYQNQKERISSVLDNFVTSTSSQFKQHDVESSSSLYPSLYDMDSSIATKQKSKTAEKTSSPKTPIQSQFSEMNSQERLLKAFAIYTADTRDMSYMELLQGDFNLSAAVVMASQYLVDHKSSSVLHWGSETSSSSKTISQLSLLILNLLQEKVAEHDRYLEFLSISGTLERLPLSTIKSVLEHGEQLSAAVGLRKHQNQQQEYGNEKQRQKTIELFADAIQRCGERRGAKPEYFTAQHFYSEVSKIHEILLQFINIEEGLLTEEPEHQLSNTNKQSNIIWITNEIFRIFAESVSDYRDSHKNLYQSQPWTSWTISTETLQRFHHQFERTETLLRTSNNNDNDDIVPLEIPFFDQLFSIVDFILHSLSVVEKTDRTMSTTSTQMNQKGREQFHQYRHQYISLFIDRKQFGYARVLGERYHDFNNLIIIAEKEKDRQRLEEYLEMFQEFNFADILFNYFYQKRQFSRLLGIDRNFHPLLTRFLRDINQPELEWMHAVETQDYATATDRLFTLAQHNNKSVTGRKTHLSLAKLCNVAKERLSPPMDYEYHNDIQNHLYLVHAQECLPGFGIELIEPETPLSAEELIAVYCDHRNGQVDAVAMTERIIAALEIFTWSIKMRSEEENKVLREKIWLSAWQANNDALTPTWADIVANESGDASVTAQIEQTVLFQSGVQYTGDAALDIDVYDAVTAQEQVDVRLKNAVWTLIDAERRREQQENENGNLTMMSMKMMSNDQEKQQKQKQKQDQFLSNQIRNDNNNDNNNIENNNDAVVDYDYYYEDEEMIQNENENDEDQKEENNEEYEEYEDEEESEEENEAGVEMMTI